MAVAAMAEAVEAALVAAARAVAGRAGATRATAAPGGLERQAGGPEGREVAKGEVGVVAGPAAASEEWKAAAAAAGSAAARGVRATRAAGRMEAWPGKVQKAAAAVVPFPEAAAGGRATVGAVRAVD